MKSFIRINLAGLLMTATLASLPVLVVVGAAHHRAAQERLGAELTAKYGVPIELVGEDTWRVDGQLRHGTLTAENTLLISEELPRRS